jgi:hypothetical protein
MKLVATAFCSRRSPTYKQTCHDAVAFLVGKTIAANVSGAGSGVVVASMQSFTVSGPMKFARSLKSVNWLVARFNEFERI